MSEKYIGILGLGVLLLIAYAMSENRKKIDYRIVLWGLRNGSKSWPIRKIVKACASRMSRR